MMSPFIYFVINIIAFVIALFLKSYISQKGKNLATKEDLEEITRKVEGIKTENAEKLENIAQQNRQILAQGEWKNQLRLAAIDKRLDAHQQAYSLLKKLWEVTNNSEENNKLLLEKCQNWWDTYSLFLTAKARDKFNMAYKAARENFALQAMRGNVIKAEETESKEKVFHNLGLIGDALKTVVEDVQLPSLADDTMMTINQDNR